MATPCEDGMMKMDDVYQLNGPRVISENIDGELIMVHLELGTYYSTDGVGADVWRLVEEGCSISEMCDVLHAQYDATLDELANAVSAFLMRLKDEGLIVNGATRAAGSRPTEARRDVRHAFRPPMLNAYRDMQDMLSLDPIHDVEAAGWPVPKLKEDDPPAATQSA